MSTRCQIGFYVKEEKDLCKYEALIYRHSDGYPGDPEKNENGVLMDILPFLNYWKTERGINDLEYCAARLLQYLCNKYDGITRESYEQFFKKEVGIFTGILGYGISNGFHGDIEYLYAIYPDKLNIYDVAFDGNEINKKVKLIKTITL